MHQATIGDNSGEVTNAEKVKLHYKSIIGAARAARDISDQLKDLKSSAKEDGVDVPALMKVIKAEMMDDAKTEREKKRKEQAEEYAHVLQLTLDL